MDARAVFNTVRSDALFVSTLQCADDATGAAVASAIRQAIRVFGGRRGCAGLVAQEFGDHPDAAVARMRWARRLIERTYPPR